MQGFVTEVVHGRFEISEIRTLVTGGGQMSLRVSVTLLKVDTGSGAKVEYVLVSCLYESAVRVSNPA